MNLKKLASNLSFAHLTGIGTSTALTNAATAESDDKDKKDDKEEDKKSKKAKAADDDTDASAESDEKKDEDDDKEKSKKAKAKDKEDDDDDSEMRGDSPAAAARKRERERCAAIFACPAAARNAVLAANLAFNTNMGREEAIAVLQAQPPAANTDRSARNPNLGAGGGKGASPAQATAARMDKNFADIYGRR